MQSGATNSGADVSPSPVAELSPPQIELINYFANLAERVNVPRSAGQIYGLLFSHPSPLAFDEIVALLKISKGSASGNLKLLRGLKAVHASHQIGDRRTFYKAETSIRHLVHSILEDGIKSHLDESESQLNEISNLIEKQSNESGAAATADLDLINKRISSLQVWHRKARKLLPWITRLTLPSKGKSDD